MSTHVTKPNPALWAPSRHKADTVFGAVRRVGTRGLHLKEHRLRWRWNAPRSLAWMCSKPDSQHNIEVEAMVYPNDNERWSKGWYDSDRQYLQAKLPGPQMRDDIASGHGINPFGKARYPDFAILAKASHRWRYHKLYRVTFTTDVGLTDKGRVIYSAQPTLHAYTTKNDDWQDYCDIRGHFYEHCMFAREEVCFAHRWISDGPVYLKHDWRDEFPISDLNRIPASQQSLNEKSLWVKGSEKRKVQRFCDPRPPGSNRN
jgi:hypothetical protein